MKIIHKNQFDDRQIDLDRKKGRGTVGEGVMKDKAQG